MARSFDPRDFDSQVLQSNGIDHAFGVPDSSLSGLLSYFSATRSVPSHILTANEGAAVALAAGYHLASGHIALAYMQNSGLANALNPLQSLAVREVFGLPMLLMIGWRGKPGQKDEPQHALIGPRVLENLEVNGIPFEEVPDTLEGVTAAVARLLARARRDSSPVALVVPVNTFFEYREEGPVDVIARARPSVIAKFENWASQAANNMPLSREAAIRYLLQHVKSVDRTVSSVGGNSRELYMVHKETRQSCFLCIGAMGHAYGLAYGVSLGVSTGRVWCIDGDGSFLMHAGNNAVLSGLPCREVIHVVIYNRMHSSTGKQPLMIGKEKFLAMAEGLPYRQKFLVDDKAGLKRACESVDKNALIVVAVNDSVRTDLPRPSESPTELKKAFMKSFALRSNL